MILARAFRKTLRDGSMGCLRVRARHGTSPSKRRTGLAVEHRRVFRLSSSAEERTKVRSRRALTIQQFNGFSSAKRMNLGDLANLGQVIALAVVISLFYVAHQIRQNTNAVRSATAQAVHEHFASWYHLLAGDAELSQVVVNGLRDYASLSEQEKARFIATFMAFLSYSQNAFLKWRERMLEPPLWMGWGASDHESRIFGGWQGILERARLPFRSRIPSPRRERSYETRAAPRRKADGRLQHRSTRRIDVASSRY